MKYVIIILMLAVLFVNADDTTNVKIPAVSFTDTIVAQDSVRHVLQYWLNYHTGYYNLLYKVTAINANIKVKIYYETSPNADWGYYNRTLIDSVVAAESTLVHLETYMDGEVWGRLVLDGFGAAGDSSLTRCMIQPVFE